MFISNFIRSLRTSDKCGPAASITLDHDHDGPDPRWIVTLPTGTRLIVDDAPRGVDVWVDRPGRETVVQVGDRPEDGFASYEFLPPTFPCGLCGDPITEDDLEPTSRHACCACGWRDRTQDGRVMICPSCSPVQYKAREHHTEKMKEGVNNLDIMTARDHMLMIERIEQTATQD